MTAKDTSMAIDAIASVSKSGQESSLFTDALQTSSGDVMHFVTDATVEKVSYDAPESIVKLVDSLHIAEEQNHSIENFLSRPIQILSPVIGPGSYGKIIAKYDVRLSSFPKVFRDKLSGFYAGHFSMNFKVLVNAQPFESGIVMLVWQPIYASVPNRYVAQMTETEDSLASLSGQPCAYLNLATQSEVNLCVPYINTTPYANFSNPNNSWGQFLLVHYTPLRSGTNSPSVPCSVYFSLSDVKLYGATIPAQGLPTGKEEVKKAGVISTFAHNVAKVPFLKELAPEIPIVANAIGNVAAAFGFSKPDVPYSNATRIKNDPLLGGTNCDGLSASHKFSVFAGCQTASTPFGLTNQDEMSIAALVKDPGYIWRFDWTTSQAAGTALTSVFVNPNCYHFEKRDGPKPLVEFYPNRLFFVAQMFSYWRGSLKFQLQFAATKFHSGRIRVVYYPAGTPASYSNASQYAYSQVLDLRDGTNFELECPYINTSAWRTVPFTTNNYSFSTGVGENVLFFYVENELRAPENCSQLIDVAISCSAGDDFELAVPQRGQTSYFCPSTSQSRQSNTVDPPEVNQVPVRPTPPVVPIVSAQGIHNMVTGTQPFLKADSAPTELCIGEQVLSLRPLTRRLELLGQAQLEATDTYALSPSFYQISDTKVGLSDTTLFGAIRALFLFQRGGMRFVFNSNEQANFVTAYNPNPPASLSPYSGETFRDSLNLVRVVQGLYPNSVSVNPNAIVALGSATSLPVNQMVEGVLDVTMPYYSKYQQLRNDYQDVSPYFSTTTTRIAQGLASAGVLFFAPQRKTTCNVYRSGADDFSMSCMIGPPMCFVGFDASKKV